MPGDAGHRTDVLGAPVLQVGERAVVAERRFDLGFDDLYRRMGLWGEHQHRGVGQPFGHSRCETLDVSVVGGPDCLGQRSSAYLPIPDS